MGKFGDFMSKFDPSMAAGRENILSSGALGAIGTLGGSLMRKKRTAEEAISGEQDRIRQSISDLPGYEITPEAQQQLEMLQQSAGAIRDTQEMGQEAVDIARARSGMAEMPGEAQARRDIQQSTAGTTQNILQAGGGASALGAIAQAGLGQQSAFGQLAMGRAQARSDAEQNLMNSLRSQAGLVGQTEGQAAQLESAGLQTMMGERQRQFDVGRENQLTGMQFDIDALQGQRADEQARRNRNAQIWSSVIGSVGDIGSKALTGGIA